MASQAKLSVYAAPLDIGTTAERLWPGMFSTASAERPSNASHQLAMELLAYARESWVLHSAPMMENDVPLHMLYGHVSMISEFKDWLTWDRPCVASHGVEISEIPEQMIWAVVHSYNTLLDTVLR